MKGKRTALFGDQDLTCRVATHHVGWLMIWLCMVEWVINAIMCDCPRKLTFLFFFGLCFLILSTWCKTEWVDFRLLGVLAHVHVTPKLIFSSFIYSNYLRWSNLHLKNIFSFYFSMYKLCFSFKFCVVIGTSYFVL